MSVRVGSESAPTNDVFMHVTSCALSNAAIERALPDVPRRYLDPVLIVLARLLHEDLALPRQRISIDAPLAAPV